jgi:adenosine deaminase
VTLSADNPLFTGSGILHEYELVRSAFGLSDDEMAGIARTSINASGMPAEGKTAALDEITRWLESS